MIAYRKIGGRWQAFSGSAAEVQGQEAEARRRHGERRSAAVNEELAADALRRLYRFAQDWRAS